MPRLSQVFTVLVAGPGDVIRERAAVVDALAAWTRRHSHQTGITLEPIGWEQARPDMSGDPQSVITKQIGVNQDAVIAVFGNRLGTATPRAISGTVEEIEEAIADGKDVMVYFADGPIPRDGLNLDQLSLLEEFRDSLKSRGLLGSYKSLPDLKRLLDDHIARLGYDFQKQISDNAGSPLSLQASGIQSSGRRSEDQALLQITTENDRGPWIYHVGNPLLADVKYRVQNIGRAPARDIKASVSIGTAAPTEIQGPAILPSLAIANREGFVLPLAQPFPGAPGSPVPEGFPDSEVIRIVLSYRDFEHDVGVKTTEPFCFKFTRVAQGGHWKAVTVPCPEN